MANFEAKEFMFSDINDGQRYQNGNVVDAEAINKPIEASMWAVNKAQELQSEFERMFGSMTNVAEEGA